MVGYMLKMLALVAAFAVGGCDVDGARSARVFPNNWAELCAQTDCERFPVGYMTTEVTDGYFYEPVVSGHNRYQASQPGQYFEVAADGRVLRGAMTNPKQNMFEIGWPCCERLVERFGIHPPQAAGFVSNMGFTYYTERMFDPPIQEIRRKHVRFQSLADLEALKLPEFDDNFWLVDEGDLLEWTDPARPLRKYLLISRKPLIFGRHVWAICAGSCDVDTFAFPDDPRPDLPHVRVHKMGYNRLADGQSCNKPGLPCEPIGTPYEAIPAGLKWVEDLITALRTKPADAPAP